MFSVIRNIPRHDSPTQHNISQQMTWMVIGFEVVPWYRMMLVPGYSISLPAVESEARSLINLQLTGQNAQRELCWEGRYHSIFTDYTVHLPFQLCEQFALFEVIDPTGLCLFSCPLLTSLSSCSYVITVHLQQTHLCWYTVFGETGQQEQQYVVSNQACTIAPALLFPSAHLLPVLWGAHVFHLQHSIQRSSPHYYCTAHWEGTTYKGNSNLACCFDKGIPDLILNIPLYTTPL